MVAETEDYIPTPIDTCDVAMSPDLLDLVERLAENAHEVWARGRFEAGWVWGPNRCDLSMQHPCLVPYEELPESEKEYDRASVISTIKVVLALGYRVEKLT